MVNLKNKEILGNAKQECIELIKDSLEKNTSTSKKSFEYRSNLAEVYRETLKEPGGDFDHIKKIKTINKMIALKTQTLDKDQIEYVKNFYENLLLNMIKK